MGRINNTLTTMVNNWLGKVGLATPKTTEENPFAERYKRFDKFAYLYGKSFDKEAVISNKEITFSNYFGFGSDIAFIKRFIGQPLFSFENPEFNVIILMYANRIHGYDVKFELHFFDNKLFCINYTYNTISEFEKANIIKTLLDKHQLSGALNVNNKIVVDDFGNGLLIEDGEHFSVNYLSPQSQVIQLAEEWLSNQQRTA